MKKKLESREMKNCVENATGTHSRAQTVGMARPRYGSRKYSTKFNILKRFGASMPHLLPVSLILFFFFFFKIPKWILFIHWFCNFSFCFLSLCYISGRRLFTFPQFKTWIMCQVILVPLNQNGVDSAKRLNMTQNLQTGCANRIPGNLARLILNAFI